MKESSEHKPRQYQRQVTANPKASAGITMPAVPVLQKKKKQRFSGTRGQDDVQRYLAKIAPSQGPIREYIANHAETNGGLCAGWVVLHRKDPDRLIRMWQQVSEKIEQDDKRGMGRATDDAVKLYMEAQYHFTNDLDNHGEFVAPDDEVLAEAGLEENPQDMSKKVGGKSQVLVQRGGIMHMAKQIHDNYKGSKKQLFVEIYHSAHTSQVEFRQGKLFSICESERGGVSFLYDVQVAEKIFASVFMKEDKEDIDSAILSFDLYSPN